MINNDIISHLYSLTEIFIEVIEVAQAKIYREQYGEGVALTFEMFDAIIHNEEFKQVFGNKDLQSVAFILNQFSEALDKKDYILACDLLQYELLPIYNQWKTFLSDKLLTH